MAGGGGNGGGQRGARGARGISDKIRPGGEGRAAGDFAFSGHRARAETRRGAAVDARGGSTRARAKETTDTATIRRARWRVARREPARGTRVREGRRDAPARERFMVSAAEVLAGMKADPATAPLPTVAARPMRATVAPRPAPDTARLAIDMQREADIVVVRV